jgi:PTS system ascorbate-specific IIA component
VPAEADFVFDARVLPNPHWDPSCARFPAATAGARLPGSAAGVQRYYGPAEDPRYLAAALGDETRSYVTVAFGCTGGKHRSVYLAERLARHAREQGWEDGDLPPRTGMKVRAARRYRTAGALLMFHDGLRHPPHHPSRHRQCHPRRRQLLLAVAAEAEAFEVPVGASPDALLPLASAALRRVDDGDGVLVLTDLYGASPSNLAAQLARLGTPVRRVSALSLPMLLRVMNYPEQGLDQLPATAAAGARNGAIIDDA